MEPLQQQIAGRIRQGLADADGKRPWIVAIDGRCASGKSTLAESLRKEFGSSCSLVHMDDFFLQPAQRTPERYGQPGENVDHERIREEVLEPAAKGFSFAYQVFDCRKMDFGKTVLERQPELLIVEGSYSLHPDLQPYYDQKFFLTCSSSVQMKRIRNRNGEEKAIQFRDRWIPLEEAYFEKLEPQKTCSGVFSTDDLF